MKHDRLRMRVLVSAIAVLFAAVFAAVFAACTEKSEKSDAPPAPPPAKTAAPVKREVPIKPDAPLHGATIDLAKVQLDLATARAAITEWRQLHEGNNPPDLAALNLRLSFPSDITYDAGSGTVKSRTFPAF